MKPGEPFGTEVAIAAECGVFSEGGRMRAGCLAADCGGVPATIWASSLDGKPLADSSRILLTHLTDVQNTGATFEDDTMRVLLAWGDLPHLMLTDA